MVLKSHKRGIAYLWLVVTLMLLIGFVGLATDVGYVVLVSQQLQNGADAAALAGGQLVKTDIPQARQEARDIGLENYAARASIDLALNEGNAANGDIVVGRFDREDRTFTPGLTNVNAIQVVARRTSAAPAGAVPLHFGDMFGVNTVDVTRVAIAMAGGGTGNGLIVLDPDSDKALYVKGSAVCHVNDGDIQVNSSAEQAAFFQGAKFIVDAPTLNVVGDVSMGGGDIGDTTINTNARAIPDPLGFLPEPTWNPANDLGTIDGKKTTYEPGYYSDGISLSGGTVNLSPGIYVLGGKGLNVSGNTNLVGHGVMLYIESGPVSLNGTGITELTPPNPEQYSYPGVDTYENVTIFQARDNQSEGLINGTSGLNLQGSLYFPDAKMVLSGTTDKLGNQFVANMIEFSGNSDITINYNGIFPAPGNRSFLVQ